jgi:hypothetical protein
MFGCMFRSFLNVAIQYSRKFKSSFLLYKYLILNFFCGYSCVRSASSCFPGNSIFMYAGIRFFARYVVKFQVSTAF